MKWKIRSPKLKVSKKDDIVTKLLKIRGVKDTEEFLNPTSKVLHDPYLLGNVVEVSERILKAIKNREKICISADCDSDGLFSTAFMVRYLSKFTDNYYISYNQRSDGHGVENQLHMITDDTNLVIVLDSSSNSDVACKELKDKGMDVVILDHHDFEKSNKHAVIVNPKLDDTYPNKFMSGVGVVYKVVQVLDNSLGTGEVDDYIDLVACGMFADMMPVDVLENRYLIIQGMKNIRNTGLLAILDVNGVSLDEVNSQTIGFTISPLINGVARLDQIEYAIDLLLCDDYEKCVEIVKEMKELNEQRKKTEKELFEKYSAHIDLDDKVLIAIDQQASKGFNGLIANKLAQEYKRPAMVMRENEGSLAGSYRSYGDFPMKEFLNEKSMKKMIKYALGHEFAGGIALNAKNFKKFKGMLNEKLADVDFDPVVEYDMEFSVDEITTGLLLEIEKFDYLTGTDFPPATFLVKGIFVEKDPRVMGKNEDTVKFSCDDIDLIKFKVNKNWGSEVGALDYLEAIGQLKINSWTNYRKEVIITNQLVVDEYRVV